MKNRVDEAVDKRYGELAEGDCCLSCGAALRFAEPQPGETGVDLGSGRGNDVLRIAEMVGESGFAYGVDISGGMLEAAGKRAERLGVKNAWFSRSELDKTGLDDGAADFVISNCTINHAVDKDAVWREIYRILKPGGRFVVSDIYAVDTVPEQYRNDPQAVAECWAGAVTRGEYMRTVHDSGFNDIRVIEESLPYDKGRVRVASFTITGHKPAMD
jgi:ubiquinone/menaquinone biosynthesis C-methylase UbiE